jgi:sodium transport system permease protein
MVVASELAMAIRSKSVKEAGALLAPASLAVIIPAVIVQVINLDGVETFWFAVPVVNVLLAMRELLLDRVDPVHTLVWLSTTAMYTGLALWYAQRQFNREDLVLSPS